MVHMGVSMTMLRTAVEDGPPAYPATWTGGWEIVAADRFRTWGAVFALWRQDGEIAVQTSLMNRDGAGWHELTSYEGDATPLTGGDPRATFLGSDPLCFTDFLSSMQYLPQDDDEYEVELGLVAGFVRDDVVSILVADPFGERVVVPHGPLRTYVTVIFDARRARLLPLDVDGNALCAALRLPYPERREHADMFGPMDRRRARGPGNVPWGSPADGVTARRDYTVEVRSSFRHRNRDQ